MYNQEKVLPFQDGERKSVQVTRMFNGIAKTYDKINHFMSLGIDRYWRSQLIRGVKKALESTEGPLAGCRKDGQEEGPAIKGPGTVNSKGGRQAKAEATRGGQTQSSPNRAKLPVPAHSMGGLKILDIATGTGDLAILAAKKLPAKQIIGIDISDGMMEIGRQKAKAIARKQESNEKRDLFDSIQFLNEDATRMSFADHSFDTIITSFGIRNFENLDAALQEMHRVLRPGGVLAMLELSEPVRSPFKQLFRVYSHTILPLIGRMIANDKQAYNYLTRSIEAFPQGEEMVAIVNKAGFRTVRFERLTFGISTLYIIQP